MQVNNQRKGSVFQSLQCGCFHLIVRVNTPGTCGQAPVLSLLLLLTTLVLLSLRSPFKIVAGVFNKASSAE